MLYFHFCSVQEIFSLTVSGFFFFLLLLFGCVACRLLIPWPRIKPAPSAADTQSFNHWTVKEVPISSVFYVIVVICIITNKIRNATRQCYNHCFKGSCEIETKSSIFCVQARWLQSCPTLWDPMDCNPSDSSVHGILQARILEWVAILFSKRSSWLKDWTCIAGRFFTVWVTRESVKVLVAQLCLTLCNPVEPTSLLCPWDSSGKNTGVGCHSLLQQIFLIKGSNLGLLHCRQILYHLSHQGSPMFIEMFIIFNIFHFFLKVWWHFPSIWRNSLSISCSIWSNDNEFSWLSFIWKWFFFGGGPLFEGYFCLLWNSGLTAF